jgi:hypothetical protein
VVVLQRLVVRLRPLVVVIGGRMLLFLLVDSGLLVVSLLELSLVVLLVLCQLRVVIRGQLFLLLMVGGRLQLVVMLLLVVVVVLLMLAVGMLHVGFWQLLVLVGGRVLPHLIADREMLMVGRLVVWLFVLS